MISYVTAWDPQDALDRLFDQSKSEKSAKSIFMLTCKYCRMAFINDILVNDVNDLN